ncbi:MAG: hypothetical protein S0880_30960 [Actinomycetota bacterium]|nr:hypothetical protein [Actinomycetota bacterium]
MIGSRTRALEQRELDAYDVLDPALAARVRIVRVPLLPPRAAGMTLGRYVLVLDDDDHLGERTLLAHELVHVRQWHDLGRVGFLRAYLGDYARHLRRLRRHHDAYRAISLEVEARDEARRWSDRRRSRHETGAPPTPSVAESSRPTAASSHDGANPPDDVV